MGEDKERKKPSSLRTRVDRARKTYAHKKNPVPIIIGAVFLVIFGVAMIVVLGKPTPRKIKPPSSTEVEETGTSTDGGAPVEPVASKPKSLEDQVWNFTEQAKFQARNDADAALQKLKGKLGVWSNFPDLHHAMAMIVETKIRKAGGDAGSVRRLSAEKLGYLEKAKEATDAGNKWAYDPNGDKTTKLGASIDQAKRDAGM